MLRHHATFQFISLNLYIVIIILINIVSYYIWQIFPLQNWLCILLSLFSLTGGATKSFIMLLFLSPSLKFWMCNIRIHWWAVWSVCACLCLHPWCLQESCRWPALPAGPAGLWRYSPGSAELLSPAGARASAARVRPLLAVAARATLQSTQHTHTHSKSVWVKHGQVAWSTFRYCGDTSPEWSTWPGDAQPRSLCHKLAAVSPSLVLSSAAHKTPPRPSSSSPSPHEGVQSLFAGCAWLRWPREGGLS